ncbi:MAG: hypothetical protein WDN69_08215 [Aliidongia sp.]
MKPWTKSPESFDETAASSSTKRSTTYLTTHRQDVEHIEAGLRQAEAGEFVSEDEVAQAFARWHV